MMLLESEPIAAGAADRLSSFQSAILTLPPRLWINLAIESPMPLAPPVMATTLPSKDAMICGGTREAGSRSGPLQQIAQLLFRLSMMAKIWRSCTYQRLILPTPGACLQDVQPYTALSSGRSGPEHQSRSRLPTLKTYSQFSRTLPYCLEEVVKSVVRDGGTIRSTSSLHHS